MLIRRLLTWLLLFATLVSTAGAAEQGSTRSDQDQEQVFRFNIGGEPPTLDPQFIEDIIGYDIARNLFEGLLVQRADGTLAPGVAERWNSNPEHDRFTFYLRKNARWSNGEAVTAHDFVYAWRRSVDPDLASPQIAYMETMAVKNAAAIRQGNQPPSSLGVKAIDDHTFEVELERSLPYFPNMVVFSVTMPVPQKLIKKYGNAWTKAGNLVGNGAYVLVEHQLNERMELVRNPYYWNDRQTHVDKLVARVINDDTQAFNRYLAGELDITNVPVGQLKRLLNEFPDETFITPRLCSYYLNINVERKPFDDDRVRRALAYAVDRDIITRHVTGSGQIPAFTFTPEATANFSVPDVSYAALSQAERYRQAKELLDSAGFGQNNPLKLTILYNTSEGHKKIAIAISQMWKQHLGVEVTLENQEWKTFLTTRDQGDFEIARAGWCGGYNEASAFLNLMRSDSEFNDSNYANPKVDLLLKQASLSKAPYAYYLEVERILAEEFPVIPIYHYTSAILVKPYLKGWPINNVQNLWYAKDLSLKPH